MASSYKEELWFTAEEDFILAIQKCLIKDEGGTFFIWFGPLSLTPFKVGVCIKLRDYVWVRIFFHLGICANQDD